MRIVFVTCQFPPDFTGGAQIQSFRFCETMGARHDVVSYVRDYGKHLPVVERLNLFTLHRRRVIGIPVLRSIVDLAMGLLYIKREHRKSTVFLSYQIQLSALMVVMARILFGNSALVSPRGAEDFDFRGVLRRRLQIFVYRHASLILVQSETIRTLFVDAITRRVVRKDFSRIIGKIRLFPNVVHDNGYRPPRISHTPIRVIYVGRLVKIKGVEYLLKAIRELGESATLKIVGDGIDRTPLEALAEGLPISFDGELPFEAVKNALAWSDLLVLPSLTENLPNVILEAMSMGLPVVATRVGGIPEIVKDGETGFLVAPGDHEAIVRAIRSLASDAPLYEKMSMSARREVENHFPDAILPVWEGVLNEAADL